MYLFHILYNENAEFVHYGVRYWNMVNIFFYLEIVPLTYRVNQHEC